MATRLLILASILLVLNCSGTGGSIQPADMAAITVSYSSGGPAPSMGTIQVFEDGRIVAQNQEGQLRRRQLASHPAFKKLKAQLAGIEFEAAILWLAEQRYDQRYSDCEELVLEARDRSVSIPTEKLNELPAELESILKLLDTLAEAVLQSAIDFHLGPEKLAGNEQPTS